MEVIIHIQDQLFYSGIQTAITAVTTNTITINVGKSELNFYDVSDATYAADTGVLVLTIGAIHYYRSN